MNIKRINLLVVAAIIDLCLGIFLLGCGLLEFTNVLRTSANNNIESIGVQLSYLVFVSGILVTVSGLMTIFDRKEMSRINLQIVLGLFALAWPIFVSISLFFSQYVICIRLLPTMLTSLFYMISILIVKISNESLRKVHRVSTGAVQVDALSTAKKGNAVDVKRMFTSPDTKAKSGVHLQNIGNLAGGKKRHGLSLSGLFQGKRRSGHSFRGIYSGSRRRGGLFRRHR